MLVHHLNAGSMRMVNPDPESPDLIPQRAVSHVLVVETPSAGLVLVDTGLGTHDIARPDSTLGSTFLARAEPVLDRTETVVVQIGKLGYTASDVRHIVLTHLDLDHAGGLSDFPDALVHVADAELRAAATAPGCHPEDGNRYRPLQWAHQPRWTPFDISRADPWFGFDTVPLPKGLPEDMKIVPLRGHSAGHVGVAVNAGTSDADRWLLHAGDAYYYHAELDFENPRSVPGFMYLQDVTEVDRELRLGNNARLRDLARQHVDEVSIFCAHDPWELQHAQTA